MSGKMKTIYGVYKKLGRDAFLEAARAYSDHVSDTIEDTIAEMESGKATMSWKISIAASGEPQAVSPNR